MRGSGKEVDDGAGSSLGSSSGEGGDGEGSEAYGVAMLAKSGLKMLAGKEGRVRPFTQQSALGVRFREDNGGGTVCALPRGGGSGGGGRGELVRTPGRRGDVVRRLSMDECWRMILELGTRWPAWNGPTTLQAPLGVTKESDDSTMADADGDHHMQGRLSDSQQREQDFVKLLATRALEALADQAPPWRSTRPDMLAPKQTEERFRNLAGGEALKAPRIPSPPARQPISSAPKATLTGPRTAELTIFYNGTVNVCDNVPADKARLIMMYAEKAGLSAQAGNMMRRAQFVPPSSRAAPQATRASHAGPSQRGLQPSRVPSPSSPSSSSLATPGEQGHSCPPAGPLVNGNLHGTQPVPPASRGKSPLSVQVTTPTRQLRQHVMIKPLPNARRNSLARFLDSRKRWIGASSEEGSPKKPALGDGGPSDAEEFLQANEKLDSVPSNVGIEDCAPSNPC